MITEGNQLSQEAQSKMLPGCWLPLLTPEESRVWQTISPPSVREVDASLSIKENLIVWLDEKAKLWELWLLVLLRSASKRQWAMYACDWSLARWMIGLSEWKTSATRLESVSHNAVSQQPLVFTGDNFSRWLTLRQSDYNLVLNGPGSGIKPQNVT